MARCHRRPRLPRLTTDRRHRPVTRPDIPELNSKEPQAGLVVRARRCVFEEEVYEAEDPVERVRDIVRDAGRELAERGRAGERNELALELGTPIVRKGQYC